MEIAYSALQSLVHGLFCITTQIETYKTYFLSIKNEFENLVMISIETFVIAPITTVRVVFYSQQSISDIELEQS